MSKPSQSHVGRIIHAGSSSSVAVLDSPELLLRIIELSVEEQSFWERRIILRSTMLVSNAWAMGTNRILWREVILEGSDQAQRLLSSPAFGRYPTIRLSVSWGTMTWGPQSRRVATANQLLEQIFAGLSGLRWLTLSGFVGADMLSPTLFCATALEDVTVLEINHSALKAEGHTSPSWKRLKQISLCDYESTSRTPLAFFSAENVTHLTIDNCFRLHSNVSNTPISDDLDDLFTVVRSMAAQLQRFELCDYRYDHLGIPSPSLTSIMPLFRQFAVLRHLRIVCSTDQLHVIAQSLPCQLDTLVIIRKGDHNALTTSLSDILNILNMHCMTVLARLDIVTEGVEDIRRAAGGPQLLKLAAGRGLRVYMGPHW